MILSASSDTTANLNVRILHIFEFRWAVGEFSHTEFVGCKFAE